jgi:hypothetical protein
MQQESKTTDLDDYSTKDLLAEIERRRTRKIIKMRQRKTWACRCGYKFTSGDRSRDCYVDFGHLWHKTCLPPQGQFSTNYHMSMGDVNVR